MSKRVLTRKVVAALVVLLSCVAQQSPAFAQQSPLLLAPADLQLGVLDGAPYETFGVIADATLDRAGNLYILDAQSKRMVVFDREGRFVVQTGRPGRGPGELSSAEAVAVDSDGVVHVLDPRNMRISHYRLENGALASVGSTRLPFVGNDLCTVHGRIFVQGVHSGRLVHEIDPGGDIVRSFGLHRQDNPALGSTLLRGSIVCSDQTIVYKPDVTAAVYGYRLDGAPLWATALAGFEQLLVRERPQGGVTFSAATPEGHDVVTTAFRLDGARIAFQVGMLDREVGAKENLTNPRTYVLDIATGNGIALLQDIPRIVDISGRSAVIVNNVPFPRLSRHPISFIGESS